MTKLTEFVLVTGMTGAGRSTAAKALEKLGYYVVDNLPPGMLEELVASVDAAEDIDRLAVVVDSRSRTFFFGLVDAIETVLDLGINVRTLYLEAADEVLVRRQEAARRPHPLSRQGRLMDGFVRERELLRTIRGRADLVIDTSRLNVHQLAHRVRQAFEVEDERGLHITIVSFGFKYGIPIDADMVADMRFLPNPYWIEELRPLSGQDDAVREYVYVQDRAQDFLDRYVELLSIITNGFLREDKLFLTVGVGCTGGRHRSVAMAEALDERLRKEGVRTLVVHRDLGRE
ncbi:RNase adapter RapZ [Aeromicrobium duanguangcaii]|uniref:RNase adapter RapZ n=1 Tax=Aeromicrobium duanguangcaii TaxID=2968086 RepID=A0ABY5KA39_9ACTN|nr:RNase adapter RapZ [Aeromicrobium duanguangcaii]MCL3837292.1 RNase adapter RapZ [Aeromicrobium duanguangcaii]UUI67324.1 RNase adapter RapZ [Aeromicrobium duanguangcaii]